MAHAQFVRPCWTHELSSMFAQRDDISQHVYVWDAWGEKMTKGWSVGNLAAEFEFTDILEHAR